MGFPQNGCNMSSCVMHQDFIPDILLFCFHAVNIL